jgi:hypothetical protein
MTAPEVRPRFEIELAGEADDLMDRLRTHLPRCPNCTGMSVGRHAELFVPEADRRLWSPWLSVTAEDDREGVVLRGRFAPHPSIWTLYLFAAFALGFSLLVGATWGYAQWATESTPWALISVPLVAILGGALYLVSLVGQRLGADQMIQLRAALDELVYSK